MIVPTADINGKPFSERDRKLLALLLRPQGAMLEVLNSAVTKPGKKPAWSFKTDSERLAKRIGGTAWRGREGLGGTRPFGIKPP